MFCSWSPSVSKFSLESMATKWDTIYFYDPNFFLVTIGASCAKKWVWEREKATYLYYLQAPSVWKRIIAEGWLHP